MVFFGGGGGVSCVIENYSVNPVMVTCLKCNQIKSVYAQSIGEHNLCFNTL